MLLEYDVRYSSCRKLKAWLPKDEYPPRHAGALEQFGREAGQIIDAFVKTVTSRERPDRIYHYTTDAGLKASWSLASCGSLIFAALMIHPN